MQKAPAAEAALVIAAELLRSLALITHQYAGRAALLEEKLKALEVFCYPEINGEINYQEGVFYGR